MDWVQYSFNFVYYFNFRFPLNREGALKVLIDCLGNKDVVISTTGMTSRELFEYR